MAKAPVHQFSEKDYDEAFRLVGRFMFSWSMLEGAMNVGMAKLLGMDVLEGAIAANNMQVRSKIHIIKTVVNLKSQPDTDATKAANKVLEKIADMSDKRNLVAHVMFAPHTKGVEFYPVKAKGKLSVPPTVWTKTDFETHYTNTLILTKHLNGIIENLTRKPKGIIAQLLETPNALLPQPDHPRPQGILPRLAPDFPQASHEKGNETPQDSPEKE